MPNDIHPLRRLFRRGQTVLRDLWHDQLGHEREPPPLQVDGDGIEAEVRALAEELDHRAWELDRAWQGERMKPLAAVQAAREAREQRDELLSALPEPPRPAAAVAPRAPEQRSAPARPASPAQPAQAAQRPAVDALEQRRRELEQRLATAQRQARGAQAAAFADSAIRAGRAFPAERRHLIDLYTAALEDDTRRGAAGPESSVATIEAWIGTRPAHSLTRELVVQGEGGVLEPQTDQPSQGQIDALLALTALGQAALANRGRR